ncbi:MAG TPA: metalloregulator ArsR/SmtB family transcription factor [Candidatus Binatia bacterium]|jgi:DNA-binding transcriptional ArsR family regulator|nr:metalloregulator ArsR/SmtB family transcription factor [Candidatus Binatia bacterium]
MHNGEDAAANRGGNGQGGTSRGKSSRLRAISALTNPVRVELLFCLCDGEKNVSKLMKVLNLGQTRVSHGLRTLMIAGFIKCRKDRNYRIYSLNTEYAGPYLMAIDSVRWKRSRQRK